MGRIDRTLRADLDYRNIYNYIAQDNPTAAANFLRKLDQKLLLLSDMPGGGGNAA
jgi:plasmid stabilization system protein ParE